MANTGKVSNQVKAVENGFELSNHTFLNQLLVGLQSRVAQTAPGLKVAPVGKKSSKGTIEVTLMGKVAMDDAESTEDAAEKTRQLMDSLKNPSNLLSLLSE